MTLVHTDARGRLSLGKNIEADRDYRVTISAHGTVTLEPVSLISDYERQLLARPDLVAALNEGAAAEARGDVVRGKRRRP